MLLGTAAAAPAAGGEVVTAKSSFPGFLDAADFGAKGDGSTDDTDSLRRAIAKASETGASGVFVPAGIFLLSAALHLPSNFQLVGAGRRLTILRAIAGTLFPMHRPDPRTVEARQRRAMITTSGVGTVRKQPTENILVADLTLDWNHCPTEGYGHSVALMDSVDHAVIRDVNFINCLPSDHPKTPAELRVLRDHFRCECLMFSNARHGRIERCYLTDAGYRPLSVSYGSLDIVFRDGIIHAENPVWRHAFSENHGDGIVRDENFVLSQLIFQDSTFILERGTPGDGICSHTGTTVVNNCDFYIQSAATSFSIVIRAFDGSRNCIYTNNRFHCDGEHLGAFSLVSTTPRTSPSRKDNEAILVAGNIVDISFARPQTDRNRALFQFQGSDRRVRVADNLVRARWAGGTQNEVIRLEENTAFSVTDNLIEIEADEGAAQTVAIVAKDCRHGRVGGNVVTGTYRHGLKMIGGRGGLLHAGNDFSSASDEPLAGSD